MLKAQAHVFISGLVHGVFFRSEIKNFALKLGLKGFVKNIKHGRVEAVFEGEKEKILKIIEFCKNGPDGAHVTNIDVKFEDFKAEFKKFEVRY